MKPAPALLAVFAVLAAPARAGDQGPELYATYCASCHGARGEGSQVAPPLIGRPPSDVHLMLDSGRMPAAIPGANEISRKPEFTPNQIDAIVRDVEGFAPHAASPALPRVARGNPQAGGELFAEDCAACHGATADGASVGANDVAPSLADASALQIAEAVRSGPGVMPRFGSDVLSDRDVRDVARYVIDLHAAGGAERLKAGGLALAHLGPVAEGFVAWLFGLGALVLFARAIGTAGDA